MDANSNCKANSKSNWDAEYARILRMGALIASAVSTLLMTGGLMLLLWHTGFDYWKSIFFEHFAATLGLLGASAASFGSVVFLRQSEGPIEFEALGLKLKGASGQVVLWAFGVVVLALCAKLLW